MSETVGKTGPQGGNSPLRRVLHMAATALAGLGGVVIFGAAVFVTVSVIKANLGMGSLRGEFELVELACAACASLFLPLCQLKKGHVMVDVFTSGLNQNTNRVVDGLWTVLFALGWAYICSRLVHGLLEFHDYGDKTMMLRAPVWWVYVPAVIGTGFSAIIAALSALSQLAPNVLSLETGQ